MRLQSFSDIISCYWCWNINNGSYYLWTPWYFIWWIDSSKNSIYFVTLLHYYVFTVIYDKFNASLLNRSITFFFAFLPQNFECQCTTVSTKILVSRIFFLERQISILEWFLKDNVTLMTRLEKWLCHLGINYFYKIFYNTKQLFWIVHGTFLLYFL